MAAADIDLEGLLAAAGPRVGERTLRLFMTACCRQFWDRFHPYARRLVIAVEDYVDGNICPKELTENWKRLHYYGPNSDDLSSYWQLEGGFPALLAGSKIVENHLLFDPLTGRCIYAPPTRRPCSSSLIPDVLWCCSSLVTESVYAKPRPRPFWKFWSGAIKQYFRPYPDPCDVERAEQAALLQDIMGHSLTPLTFENEWLEWRDGTVRKIARRIYEQRAFGDLPILGDALEEAGCNDPAILEHCRKPAVHARGCWLLDGALGLLPALRNLAQ